jgi:hypothetical protein
MRAAILLSGFFLIGGVAAFFGIPAVQVHGRPVIGVVGLVTSLIFAAVPPVVVLGWRRLFTWIERERQWRRDHIAAFAAVTERGNDGLTLFQQQATVAVAEFVAPSSYKRAVTEMDGSEYLVAPLGKRGAELHVFPNEAAIFGAKPYAWFEEWAYRSPGDLLQALVKECARRAA